jgi:hypothetical protein
MEPALKRLFDQVCTASVIATTTSRPITVFYSPLQCLSFQVGVAVVPSVPPRSSGRVDRSP